MTEHYDAVRRKCQGPAQQQGSEPNARVVVSLSRHFARLVQILRSAQNDKSGAYIGNGVLSTISEMRSSACSDFFRVEA